MIKGKATLLKVVIAFAVISMVDMTPLYAKNQHGEKSFFEWKEKADGIISTETGSSPTGHLWISPETKDVRALLFAFQNMCEETLFKMECFRSEMARMGIGILWIEPGFGQEWDVNQGIQDPFNNLIKSLANTSGHSELCHVPLIPFGHSAQATMPWNFAAWNPERTLCLISFHGDAPRTNLCGYGRSNIEWGRTRNIDGIPGLMVVGEYEWWEDRITPALAFKMMYPQSCISFLGDAGRGHFDLSERTALYMAKFIEKAMQQRNLASGLKKINPDNGWMAARWRPGESSRPDPAPANEYTGCPHDAFWYFDEEMAILTEQRYADTEGKRSAYIGFVDEEKHLLNYNPEAHCKMKVRIQPDKNDEFELHPVFTNIDRTELSTMRQTPIQVKYVSGPAISLGYNRFKIDRTHPTWDNPRRRASVVLCAEAPGDTVYKETVQEIEVIIP